MKLNAHQRLERLNLYGLVQSLSYVVRLNDLKTAQRLRVRLALVLRQPKGLAKSLHAELTQLFAISGVWVRNVSDRHDTKRHIQELIRRILPGSRQLPPNWRGCLARLCLCDGTPEVSKLFRSLCLCPQIPFSGCRDFGFEETRFVRDHYKSNRRTSKIVERCMLMSHRPGRSRS